MAKLVALLKNPKVWAALATGLGILGYFVGVDIKAMVCGG